MSAVQRFSEAERQRQEEMGYQFAAIALCRSTSFTRCLELTDGVAKPSPVFLLRRVGADNQLEELEYKASDLKAWWTRWMQSEPPNVPLWKRTERKVSLRGKKPAKGEPDTRRREITYEAVCYPDWDVYLSHMVPLFRDAFYTFVTTNERTIRWRLLTHEPEGKAWLEMLCWRLTVWALMYAKAISGQPQAFCNPVAHQHMVKVITDEGRYKIVGEMVQRHRLEEAVRLAAQAEWQSLIATVPNLHTLDEARLQAAVRRGIESALEDLPARLVESLDKHSKPVINGAHEWDYALTAGDMQAEGDEA